MIQQGGKFITTAEGGIPVVLFNDEEEYSWIAATTVNFLRCGCPRVQILLSEKIVSMGKEEVERHFKNIQNEFTVLKTPNENFFANLSWRLISVSREFRKQHELGAV